MRIRSIRSGFVAASILVLIPACKISIGTDDLGDDIDTADDVDTTADDDVTSTDDDVGTTDDDVGTTDDATDTTTDDATDTTDDATDTTTDDTTGDTTGDTTETTSDTGGPFEFDVYPIIMANCSCHVAGAPAGLSMADAATAYNNLVGVPATGDPNFNRVEPGDAANSFIYMKLTGTQTFGAQMPFGLPALDPADIAVIEDWIANGALP